MRTTATRLDATESCKRKRSDEEDTLSLLPDDADDRSKPRRVNPLHLAARLGPDLVREMEVHIKPGAYMPSFAIRKDLQERYAVDRRHLYDYFHSRGLRVAKEERFNNLARSRQKKAQEKAAAAMKENTTLKTGESRKRQAQAKRQPLTKLSSNAVSSHKIPPASSSSTPTYNIPKNVPASPIRESESMPSLSSSAADTAFQEITHSSLSPDTQECAEFQDSPCFEALSPEKSTAPPSPAPTSVDCLPPFTIEEMPNLGDDDTPGFHLSSEIPDSPLFHPFDDLENSLSNIDDFFMETEPSFDIMPDAKSLLEPEERSRIYGLIQHAATLHSNALDSLGTYSRYMSERRNSYYNALLSAYEDTQMPSAGMHHGLGDSFVDFDSWLVNDNDNQCHELSKAAVSGDVSSAQLPASTSPADFLSVNFHTSTGRDIYSARVHPSVPPLQWFAPRAPVMQSFEAQMRVRRCSVSSKGSFSSARRRSISSRGM